MIYLNPAVHLVWIFGGTEFSEYRQYQSVRLFIPGVTLINTSHGLNSHSVIQYLHNTVCAESAINMPTGIVDEAP